MCISFTSYLSHHSSMFREIFRNQVFMMRRHRRNECRLLKRSPVVQVVHDCQFCIQPHRNVDFTTTLEKSIVYSIFYNDQTNYSILIYYAKKSAMKIMFSVLSSQDPIMKTLVQKNSSNVLLWILEHCANSLVLTWFVQFVLCYIQFQITCISGQGFKE